jgi:parallel beta-helix repeat protein
LIAQNGVQVAGGAAADVRHNFVSGHIYTPQTVTSTGVLIFGSGVVNVDHNTITSNDVGEYTSSNSAPSTVQHNRIRASTFDGAFAESTTNQRVVKNKTEENTGPGIGLYDSQNNVINDNHVKDNADGGILLYAGGPSTNNMVSDNKVRDNGSDAADTTDGIRVEAGQIGNVFDGNHLRDNLTHDCHDMNATGNTWTNNKGETSVPPGICGKDDDESSFATSTAFGWDASYPWYVDMGVAEFDWAAAYATIDTNSLLQVLPQLGLGTRGRASPHR